MASYRIGIGSFNLKDGNIGIGTETTGFGNLKVEGTIKTNDLDVGVSTFTRYSGFEAEQNNIIRDQTLSGEYSTTGDIVVDTGKTLTVGLGSTACIGSVECISVKHHFSVPVGDTVERDKSSGYAEGTVRYNRDLGTMEFFNGNEWRQFRYQSDTGNRGRGVIGGGHNYVSTIQAWEIATLGSAFMFGDLTNARAFIAGNVASEIRGIFGGGRNPAVHTNRIDYITIASSGHAIDFGERTQGGSYGCATASQTRFVMFGSRAPSVDLNIIDFVNIASTGDAIDFGDISWTTGNHAIGALSDSHGGLGGF